MGDIKGGANVVEKNGGISWARNGLWLAVFANAKNMFLAATTSY